MCPFVVSDGRFCLFMKFNYDPVFFFFLYNYNEWTCCSISTLFTCFLLMVIETYTCVYWWHSFSFAFNLGLPLVWSQSLYQIRCPITQICNLFTTLNTASPTNGGFFNLWLLEQKQVYCLYWQFICVRLLKIRADEFTCLHSEQRIPALIKQKYIFF